MPRTGYSYSRDIVLELDETRSYTPGQTISGTLKFTPSGQFEGASVRYLSLTLWGRGKTKLIRHNGNKKTIYRGRAVFFDNKVELIEGSNLDADSSTRSTWRFTTFIPTAPNSPMGGDSWGAASPFISSKMNTSTHTLAPVFYYNGKTGLSGSKKEAYIEYAFSATVHLSKPGKDHSISERKVTIPLVLRLPGTNRPISDFNLLKRSSMILCKTLQLLPDKQDASLTFRERMRTTFQPSKIPQYAFDVTVEYPTLIQLSNSTIPFKIRIEPRMDEKFTTIPASNLPGVKIVSFVLAIESTMHLRVRGSFGIGGHTSDKSDTYTIFDSGQRVTGAEEVAITLPSDPTKTFDLGAHLNLAVLRTHANILQPMTDPLPSLQPTQSLALSSSDSGTDSLAGINNYPDQPLSSPPPPPPPPPTYQPTTSPKFHRPLSPSFNSYNIAQTHRINWKLRFCVVGTTTDDSHRVEGASPITVITEPESVMAREDREFDGKGTKKNHDDAKLWAEQGLDILGDVIGNLV